MEARAGRLEDAQVRAMFDRIAGVYDLMNTAMTAGLHHRWRARAADLARLGPGDRVLDVATGTGDLALELAAAWGPAARSSAATSPSAMLARARAKTAGRASGACAPRFEWADALALPYAEDSFDAATVGFGARNFADLRTGLREMARVVRPGGRVVVLEITTPQRPPLSLFYRLWFDRVVPALGGAAGALARRPARRRGAGGPPDRRRRLQLPAELGPALSRAGGARRRDGGRRSRRHRLRAHRRRDHRDPRRHGAGAGGPMSTLGSLAARRARPRERRARRDHASRRRWLRR